MLIFIIHVLLMFLNLRIISLLKFPQVMRRVHKNLVDYGSLSSIKDDFSDQGLAAVALKEKRLTLTWLDGELQSVFIFLYQNIVSIDHLPE